MSYEDSPHYQKAMENFVIRFSDGKGYYPATGQKIYNEPTIRREFVLKELQETEG